MYFKVVLSFFIIISIIKVRESKEKNVFAEI